MVWIVDFTKKSADQRKELPSRIRAALDFLVKELETLGPIRGNWKNFSKLTRENFHCHLKNGKPTYVACWRIADKNSKLIEVYYAGTHEKAPY